ncbi:MAG: hypothetical protein VW683_00240 [Betaproteobacteria bacterium]|jgi:hypothetical protein
MVTNYIIDPLSIATQGFQLSSGPTISTISVATLGWIVVEEEIVPPPGPPDIGLGGGGGGFASRGFLGEGFKKKITVKVLYEGKVYKDSVIVDDLTVSAKDVNVHVEKNNYKVRVRVLIYTEPNFEYEWEEAIRYPELKKLGKTKWMSLAKLGKEVKFSSIKKYLSNTDANEPENFEKLDKEKQLRFYKALKTGIIEMPIALKFSNKNYDLLGGNTRLTGLVKYGADPKIWVIDMRGN